MTILDEIVAYKREVEVPALKGRVSIERLKEMIAEMALPLDFTQALRKKDYPALIAEIKKASPSKGLLCPDFNPERLASLYAENGASAISVLTDERYFQGNLDILRQVRKLLPGIPLLRKDFIVDEYQIFEARAAGADAVLLIAGALTDAELVKFLCKTRELSMTALIETHDEFEMGRVLPLSPRLIGVNNRNLHDFSVDILTSQRLRKLAPQESCFVAESGIHTKHDVERVHGFGVDAVLVGEALVTAENVGEKVRELSVYDPD